MTDSQPGDITILHSVNRLLATKRIRRDHKTGKLVKSPYGNEKHFRIFTVNLTSFSDLAECLCGLTQQHCAFVVRGEPLPETNRERGGAVRLGELRPDVPLVVAEGVESARRNELRSKIPTGQRQTWRLKSSKPDRLLARELVP
jgi:hypothetical protein